MLVVVGFKLVLFSLPPLAGRNFKGILLRHYRSNWLPKDAVKAHEYLLHFAKASCNCTEKFDNGLYDQSGR